MVAFGQDALSATGLLTGILRLLALRRPPPPPQVKNAVVSVDDQRYHPECFVCTVRCPTFAVFARTSWRGSHGAQSTTALAPRSQTCQKPLAGAFYKVNGRPYCADHHLQASSTKPAATSSS